MAMAGFGGGGVLGLVHSGHTQWRHETLYLTTWSKVSASKEWRAPPVSLLKSEANSW
jgi:hypothetical protein